MALKINYTLPILLTTLFCFSSVALATHHRGRHRPIVADEEVLRCLEQCDNTDVYSYLSCQKSCELQYREREAGSEPRPSRPIGPRWEPHGGGQRPPVITPQQEYDQCRQFCKEDEPDAEQQQLCEEQCEERLRARERLRDRERERELAAGTNSVDRSNSRDWYEKCLQRCERVRRGQQRQLCRFRCRPPQRWRLLEDGKMKNYYQPSREDENPYYFHSGMFRGQLRTEEGHIRVLQKFTERSELLRGIENYRLAVLEANPNTFIVPHHSDADYILFVVKGSLTIHLVLQENRESHNLERGDVIRVPAGTTTYLVNADGEEPIQIVKLIRPINTPGSFQAYYPAGSGEPESYYQAFSTEVLETALNTPREQLERLLGQQRRGVIIRAEEEQLRALSRLAGSRKKKGHGGSSKSKGEGPFNLLNQQAIYSNKFGQFFQASPDDYKQLQDLGISVTFAQLNQGTMFLPHYNSKTTTLVFVAEGTGRFEMACPHLAGHGERRTWERRSEPGREGGQRITGRYHRVTSHLSPGDVFVIPPGHPITIIASPGDNLNMIGFGINALNNQRNFLAGKVNIVNQIEREAKELAFNVRSREIDGVFSNQQESYFVAPAGIQPGKRRTMEPILDLF